MKKYGKRLVKRIQYARLGGPAHAAHLVASPSARASVPDPGTESRRKPIENAQLDPAPTDRQGKWAGTAWGWSYQRVGKRDEICV
jgi:hypothetical protein